MNLEHLREECAKERRKCWKTYLKKHYGDKLTKYNIFLYFN